MMSSTRFCVIKTCENCKGTKDYEIAMFRYTFFESDTIDLDNLHIRYSTLISRIPKPPDLRQKWIEVIESVNGTNFRGIGLVCSSHFLPNEIIRLPDRFKLAKDAIPTIFNYLVELTDTDLDASDTQENTATEKQCTCHINAEMTKKKDGCRYR